MDRPLQIRHRISRIALSYCVAVMLLSWLAIALADLPRWVQLLLVLLVMCCTARAVYRHVFPDIFLIEHNAGGWRLHGNDGVMMAALTRDVFVGSGLVLLPFIVGDGRKKRVLLWPDSASPETLRRLRLLLLKE